MPALVPAWLVLSEVSAQAVRLYCLYKLGVGNFSQPPVHFPRSPQGFAAALRLDLEQYSAVHQELIDVGAIEEVRHVDEAGKVELILRVNELSPSQRVEEDERRRLHQRLLAERRATEEDSGQTPVVAKGFVYVIGQVGTKRVKIGYTQDLARRLKALQTSNPYKLEVLWQTAGDMRLEEKLHRRFAKRRIQGEWFDFGRFDPVKAIEKAVNQIQESQ
ncbi:T5orf172 domain-containing protein [Lentzea atacamensis]|uniref:T5orf172 domain-containing protein n=2 Tax=Lentzea atacamensis TaxID=531938 RepID=A0A316HV49_9PSEU|nr:T5orf172 domain-containing protein [Lentzea atacamensis]